MERTDASEFDQHLSVQGEKIANHCILRASSPIVANAIAAFLIHVEKTTGRAPHIYFKWKEGNPVANIIEFLFLGEGDTAPLTHEVVRKAVPDIATPPYRSRKLTDRPDFFPALPLLSAPEHPCSILNTQLFPAPSLPLIPQPFRSMGVEPEVLRLWPMEASSGPIPAKSAIRIQTAA